MVARATVHIFCGDVLSVKYNMHYREACHGPKDWAGLYVIKDDAQPDDDVDWTPYVFTHPIEVVKLPPDNAGTVHFVNHPVYPGTYEVRFFIHQDIDSCIGITAPIKAKLPFTNFTRHAPLLRELRFYLAAPFTYVCLCVCHFCLFVCLWFGFARFVPPCSRVTDRIGCVPTPSLLLLFVCLFVCLFCCWSFCQHAQVLRRGA